jgi:hypothetical protein
LYYGIAPDDGAVWCSAAGAVLSLDGHGLLLLGFNLDLGLLDVSGRRAHLARAIGHVAVLVGAQPQEMGKKFDGTPEAFLGALWVSVEVCILSIVAAARVVLDRLQLSVCLGLDVLVEDVVFRQLPQDALLPLVCHMLVCSRPCASHLAYPLAACRPPRAEACHPASCASLGASGRPCL